MRDVMEVLAKLPPAVMLWQGDRAYIIRRGVMGKAEYPITSSSDVDIWNYEHKITPQQVAAMDAGATFGWDSEGADLKLPGGDPTYIFSAPLQVMLSVNASFEDDAAKLAGNALDQIVDYMNGMAHNHLLTILRDGKLDLIEENKNG